MKYKNKIRLQDQDILNIYFNGKVTYAPLSWNVGTRLFQKNELKVTFTKEEWLEAIVHPKLVHFTDKSKPWFIKCTHPLVKEYIKYQHPKFKKSRKRFLYNLLKLFYKRKKVPYGHMIYILGRPLIKIIYDCYGKRTYINI